MRKILKPKVNEYPSYSHIYMDLLNDDGNILIDMQQNLLNIKKLAYSLTESQLLYRYKPKKWTIKEILVHNIDDERIFSYRSLRYARNDSTPLHGFEENDYAKYSEANDRNLDSIFNEYDAVRQSTISLYENLPENSFDRSGMSVGNINNRTVRALIYHIAGHELHHFNIIKERYL